MMINKRLIGAVPESRAYIVKNVAFQWLGLAANIAMILAMAVFLQGLAAGTAGAAGLAVPVGVGLAAAGVRWLCAAAGGKMGFLASRAAKHTLRSRIYEKLLRLGPAYSQKAATAEVVQVATEGVDQLETYFGAYLPQFFYSMLAPLTLFGVLVFISWRAALALLICVPLIPAAIAAVQTFAKKLLARYWGRYTALGDTFLENLQGLTTLKIYQADGYKQKEMAQQAEEFRRVTMRVLTMQLNSITVMDLVAYGGAALGMALAVGDLAAGRIGLGGCFAVLLLSADFFIPMRRLGSFFHIAMNGMAASDKIFALLDLPDPPGGSRPMPAQGALCCRGLGFCYEAERPVLKGLDMTFEKGSFTALVGESGSGKSTVAKVLAGRLTGFEGQVTAGGVPLGEIRQEELFASVTYVGHGEYLFGGTVAENLRMARPEAGDEALRQVLRRVKLDAFLAEEQGLDTQVGSRGSRLSGGQRQRLALARALLADSPVYIFDEAASNIDVESENDIMAEIRALAKEKTVILISHRLANVVDADCIYVLDKGAVAGSGSHSQLLKSCGVYQELWQSQVQLEQFGKVREAAS